MSYCRKEGKDEIIFVTAADHSTPSTIQLPEPEPTPGLILPSGEINWNCPCLGGMATGPCGLEFREAFSCFHNSTSDPKGKDCFDTFKEMHLCMAGYPELYAKDDEDIKDPTEFELEASVNEELLEKGIVNEQIQENVMLNDKGADKEIVKS